MNLRSVAVFEKPGQLGKMLVGMNKMLGEIPLTVKFRTGIKQDKNIAHKFVPRFAQEWGVSAMTVSLSDILSRPDFKTHAGLTAATWTIPSTTLFSKRRLELYQRMRHDSSREL
jgi:hypothetical protein